MHKHAHEKLVKENKITVQSSQESFSSERNRINMQGLSVSQQVQAWAKDSITVRAVFTK